VTGRVEGIFKVEDCLEILGTGWVEGEVELSALVVDEGGTLQGTCIRRAPAKPKDVVPFVPRKEDVLPDRYAHPVASGTHGPMHDPFPPAWGLDRRR
jgi:cytoskeletal protein CcmA (bactofilin family)